MMLNKEDAVKRIMDVTWETALEEPAHVRAGSKDRAREIVRSCLEGYAEGCMYVMRNRIDAATAAALETSIKAMKGDE